LRIAAMVWGSRNVEHIARHGVAQEEIEELIEGPCLKRKTRSGCYMVYGRSYSGRYLAVVVSPRDEGYAYVVTAREMTGTEKKWFRRRL
jgi:uncharacterized DUF497 family protein